MLIRQIFTVERHVTVMVVQAAGVSGTWLHAAQCCSKVLLTSLQSSGPLLFVSGATRPYPQAVLHKNRWCTSGQDSVSCAVKVMALSQKCLTHALHWVNMVTVCYNRMSYINLQFK